MKRFINAAAFFGGLIVLWQLLYDAHIWSPVLVPSPVSVAGYLQSAARDGTLAEATLITMRRLLIGYVIGIIGGLPLGLLTARWNVSCATRWAPCHSACRLFRVSVGFRSRCFGLDRQKAAMLFVVVMGTLWSVVIATDTGVRNVPPIYRRAALTMGSKNMHLWLKVILPAALPFIVSGMKQGWAFAWRSLMAAEIFVSILTGFGLGQLLHFGREQQAMEQVIGIMAIIVAIGLLADKIFFSPIEQFLHRRWGTGSSQ